jgi:hypothetical protein
MLNMKGRLQYDRARGVVYFFPDDDVTGACLLRIEGVPPTAIEEGDQIDIHLVHAGNAHHHADLKGNWVDGAICAVKLKA